MLGFTAFSPTYVLRWRRAHTPLPWHGPYLAFSFAMLTVAFGIALLVAMLLIP